MNDHGKRVYVATSFLQYERARAFAQRLRDAGHTVSYDWTLTDEFGGDGHPMHPDVSIQGGKGMVYAALDQRGVRTADLVVQLADCDGMRGAHWEAGMAAAYGIPVVIVDPMHYVVFHDLPNVVVVADDDEAVGFVEAYALI